MRSLLPRARLGAVVTLAITLRGPVVDAQPAPSAPDPATASQRAKAAKLTDEAIAAEKAKNYTTAIALYQQAYRLEAHPLLMFNVGQAYTFIGNPAQAERFYRRYLELDPMGPGAPTARKFLASLVAPASSPPQPARPAPAAVPRSPQPAVPTTPEKVAAVSSNGTRAPAGASPAAGGARVTVTASDKSELHPERIRPPTKPIVDENRSRNTTAAGAGATAIEARDKVTGQKRLEDTQHLGYALVGTGVVLGAIAIRLGTEDYNEYSVGLGVLALGAGVGGVAALLYVDHQRSAARTVAWSPVIGAGFAGVALAGPLP